MEENVHACCAGHCAGEERGEWETYLRLLFALAMLVAGIVGQHAGAAFFRHEVWRPCWFALAWLPVALPVAKEAWEALRKGGRRKKKKQEKKAISPRLLRSG